ncbi:MAG TPA: anti-sigma factor [candidate division Zixibacteria bacterium]|nr:anti-sigma factor [candidate division Zixibacteria bacterium]
MRHQDAIELIDAYALGTLPADETAALEAHLDTGCAECLARLRSATAVAELLAGGLQQHEPSPELRGRILSAVADGGAPATYARPTPLPPTPTPLSLRLVSLIGAAAAVALFVWTLSLNQKIDELSGQLLDSQLRISQLRYDSATSADLAFLLGQPCTRLLDLKGVEPNPNAYANLVLHPDQDFALAYMYRLPEPPQDREYQLWLKRDGQIESAGVFRVGRNGEAVIKLDSLPMVKSIDSFMVTIEYRGGAPRPTGMVYLSGENIFGPTH